MFAVLYFISFIDNHRDSHSFPTRRSSDLPLYGRDRMPARRLLPLLALGLAAACGRGADSTGAATTTSTLPAGPDRKSTRLNSSHRCISYAVFCLKQKISNNITK